MSNRTHTVVTGDTLFKIAMRYYGDGWKYPRIYAANPFIKNPDLIFPGQVLIIPELEIDKPEEEEIIDIANSDSEVSITVDGKKFNYFQSVDIDVNFDKIAEFVFSFPFDYNDDNVKRAFAPFKQQAIEIFIGNERLTTGYITRVMPESTQDSSTLTVSGYARCGIIFDRYMPTSSFPLSFDGLDLKQIAEKLCQPFSVKAKFSDTSGAKFQKADKVVMKIDETPGDFLVELAKKRGFIITSDRNGDLFFQKLNPSLQSVFSLEGGKPPVLSTQGTEYDLSKRYSDVSCFTTNNQKGAGKIQTETDSELKKNGIVKPLIFDASDSNEGSLKDIAKDRVGRSQGEAVNVVLTVEGWRKSDNKLWVANEIIDYVNPADMIYRKTNFLVRQVRYLKNENAQTTTLTLALPESYNGNSLEVFPWEI